jgi:NAD+ diphosphatase
MMLVKEHDSRPTFITPQHIRLDDRFILFFDGQIVCDGPLNFWTIETINPEVIMGAQLLCITQESERDLIAVYLNNSPLESLPGAELRSLRSMLLSESRELFMGAGVAKQLEEWLRGHKYCGSCGGSTIPHTSERALVCLPCERHYYPRINPCVIVLVVRDDKMLLAKSSRYNADFYSCLAGFMEVGESPEDTVRREVFEEVGIKVGRVDYISSQSWPFPSQLMLGFIAQYESGEITPEPSEIADAEWFDQDNLPNVPSARISVAGKLIAHFLERE